MTEWLMRKLCTEDLFPKRSRWLISGKIADLLNDYMIYVVKANEIKVVTQQERDDRHRLQTLAVATLQTLDVKINQAQRILDIEPEKMKYWGVLCNDCRNLLLAWMNSDNKRYGLPTKFNHTQESG